MKNYVQCKGIDLSLHENTIFNFDGEGMVLSVSLNIPKKLCPLFGDRVIKGKDMYLIRKKMHIKSIHIDVFNVKKVHDHLLKSLMKEIREKKSKYYSQEAKKIEV